MLKAFTWIHWILLLFTLGQSIVLVVDATTLTYMVKAGEKACFHAWVDEVGQKVAFYFAVQTGGNFDIDYVVLDPAQKIVMNAPHERQGDFVFSSTMVGEHSFCFSSEQSSYADKLVDFEIVVQGSKTAVKAQFPLDRKDMGQHLNPLEESLFKIGADLSDIARSHKYFRTREHRNMETVQSTESRVFWLSIVESLLIVGVASLQVYVIRNFFSTPSKSRI